MRWSQQRKEKIFESIVELVHQENGVTTNDVSTELKIGVVTAKKYLDMLAEQGLVVRGVDRWVNHKGIFSHRIMYLPV